MALQLPGRSSSAVTGTSGAIVRFSDSDAVYFLQAGTLHYIAMPRWLPDNGFGGAGSAVVLPPELRPAFRWARPASLRYDREQFLKPLASGTLHMREIAASQLSGTGLEIGAGANPFPIPLHCDVLYGDLYTYAELLAHPYPGQESYKFVEPTIRCELDDLSAIPDQSLDFIVACHVIEHTRSPISAIVQAHRVLKPGGSIVLVVPNKVRTFDNERPVTELEHLVRDHVDYSRERDRDHYVEFYTLAFRSPQYDDAYVEKQFQEAFPIHYHVWTYESFQRMIRHILDEMKLFSSVWSHDTIYDDKDANEFYFVLTK